MKILAITNQKGGVGKTTTCVNLAASLASFGKRVLLIDLDPQGNASTGSGVDKAHLKHSIYHVLIGEKSLKEVILKSEKGGFDIAPSNRDLAGAEVELVNELARENRLKVAIAKLVSAEEATPYDFVLLDCPPALNLVTVNALTASSAVMIPMQCEYYALEGLSDLVNTIKKVRARLNPTLEIEGLLRTLFDNRNMLAQQVSAQLISHFGDKVYKTIIPRNIRLAEAPSYGVPVLNYDKSSKGAVAYLELAKEVMRSGKNMAKLKGLNRGLGRGLDSLLAGDMGSVGEADSLLVLKVEQLQPGKYQPRSYMDDAALQTLAASIKSQGIMQPILVRHIDDEKYEIIAGERRWRASQIAGLEEVPVLVREIADEAALAMALIENIQRENLNPLEEAQGIKRLIEEFEMTHEKAAAAVGRSRVAVSNLLRLLTLCSPVQEMLIHNKLDMGHARALIGLSGVQQVMLAEQIVQNNLSVREVENLVKKLEDSGVEAPQKQIQKTQVNHDVLRLQEALSDKLGATVSIKAGAKGAGTLKISYANLDQLDEIVKRITR